MSRSKASPQNTLIIFSNPDDTRRLRLDREQRTLGEVEKKHDAANFFHVLSAATVEDLIQALRQPSLRVVHFAGHGSPDGIYLESSATTDIGFQLSPEKLNDLILSHSPKLEALILSSCYSAESSLVLRHAAPYVITVEGPADDNAAIMFTKLFYDNLLDSDSLELSLTRTQIELQSLDLDEGLQIYVTRRGEYLSENRITLQSIKSIFNQETVLIDITDIMPQIQQLDIPEGKFIALLANKIYVHQWLYMESYDMEYAVFPIGKYFAVFSWKNGMDVLVCRRLLLPKPEATEEQCSIWMRLSFRYTRLFCLPYRRERQQIYAGMNKKLQYAIDEFGNYLSAFEREETLLVLRGLIPDQLKMALPLISENHAAATSYFYQEDFSQTIVHLETTLSLIHGLLDGLVDALAA